MDSGFRFPPTPNGPHPNPSPCAQGEGLFISPHATNRVRAVFVEKSDEIVAVTDNTYYFERQRLPAFVGGKEDVSCAPDMTPRLTQ
jgi:hypothetical protein